MGLKKYENRVVYERKIVEIKAFSVDIRIKIISG
jgi:hypothetical protein